MRKGGGLKFGLIIALSCLVAAATWIFAKDKPAAIDDPYFLLAAESMVKNPLRPFDFMINWEGYNVPAQVYSLYDPPVWPAILAAFMKLGRSEAFLHLVQVPFHILALLAIYALARGFGTSPILAWTLAALSPAIIVPASTFMPDIPAIALAWWGLWFFCSNRPKWHAPAGALCFVAAGLMKFSIFPVIGMAAAAVWWRRGELRRGIAWILAALLLLSIWPSLQMALHTAQNVFALPLWKKMWHEIIMINKLAYSPAALGAAFIFPSVWLVLLASRVRDRKSLEFMLLVLGLVLAAMTAVYGLGMRFYHRIHMPGWGPPFGVNALWFLASILLFLSWITTSTLETIRHKRPRNRSQGLLLIWIAISVACVVLFSPFPNVRFLLSAFPAVAILVAGEMENLLTPKTRRWIQAAVLASTAWLGLSLLQSDVKQAQCSQDLMATVRDMYPSKRTFLTGHWGMQYYAARHGILQTTIPGREPRKGDIVLIPYITYAHTLTLPEGLVSRRINALSCLSSRISLRTMDRDSGAAFYGGISRVPYTFSRNSMETLFINEIRTGK